MNVSLKSFAKSAMLVTLPMGAAFSDATAQENLMIENFRPLYRSGQLAPKQVYKDLPKSDDDHIILGPGHLVVITDQQDTLVLKPDYRKHQKTAFLKFGAVRDDPAKPVRLELILEFGDTMHYLTTAFNRFRDDLASGMVGVESYDPKTHGPITFHNW